MLKWFDFFGSDIGDVSIISTDLETYVNMVIWRTKNTKQSLKIVPALIGLIEAR